MEGKYLVLRGMRHTSEDLDTYGAYMSDEDRNQVFSNLASYGQLDLAQQWYAKYNINVRDGQAFKWCCRYGHTKFVAWMLELGIQYAQLILSLQLAIDNKHMDIALKLCELPELAQAYRNWQPHYLGCEMSLPQYIKLLKQKTTDHTLTLIISRLEALLGQIRS